MYGTAEACELPRHAVQREDIPSQIDSEKHHRHGHLLAARSRGLSFCRPWCAPGKRCAYWQNPLCRERCEGMALSFVIKPATIYMT